MINKNRLQILITFPLIVVCFFISCQLNSKHNSIVGESDGIAGQLFIVAPSLDSVLCLAYGECDCCHSHFLFINDSEFIAVSYCLESDAYFTGTYIKKDNRIIFQTDGLFVNKEYNIDEGIDSINNNAGEMALKANRGEPVEFIWKKEYCRGNLIFKTKEPEPQFGTIDTSVSIEDLSKEIKQEGIWTLLRLK